MITQRTLIVGCTVCLLVGVAGSLVSQGQNSSNNDDPSLSRLTTRVDNFLQDVSVDQVPEAYTALLSGSSLEDQTASVQSLIEKTRALSQQHGKCWNVEQVSAKRIGNDLVVLTYLYKCERLPIVWHVVFYRTNERNNPLASSNEHWTVLSVRFDTEWEGLGRDPE